jgi:hypothetical protein
LCIALGPPFFVIPYFTGDVRIVILHFKIKSFDFLLKFNFILRSSEAFNSQSIRAENIRSMTMRDTSSLLYVDECLCPFIWPFCCISLDLRLIFRSFQRVRIIFG